MSHDLIEARAYQIWESEGRISGRELDHWLQAQAEHTKTAQGSGASAAETVGGPSTHECAAPAPRARKPRSKAATSSKRTAEGQPKKPAAKRRTARPRTRSNATPTTTDT